MIDFKEEIKKYKPVLEMEELAKDINVNEIQDVMKMLQYVMKKNETSAKE